jgi:septal ring factor EnvC (AmiA/AmiB activator)
VVRPGLAVALALVAVAAATAPLTATAQAGSAEARAREHRATLDLLRRQRDSAAAQLRALEATTRDITARQRNLEQQTELTIRTVNAYNRQLAALTEEVDTASASLVRAEDDLLIKQATMRRRIVDIYKRGPLYSAEALFSAESFGQLVARYKYLRTIAQDDRVRVRRMEELRAQIASKRDLLVVLQNEIAIARDAQADEQRRLRSLESQLQRRLTVTRESAEAARRQIQRFAADSARIANALEAIEAERRRAAARGETPAATSRAVPSTARGQLDWPVEGNIIYSFGRLRNPNQTEIRWDGIGIQAPLNTPVKAIADGVVVLADNFATYGLCVFLSHGDDYSLYCSLGRATVAVGETVTQGQQVGTVGNDPDVGPHLHFQIRVRPRGGTSATAIDPLDWLRPRR